MEKKREGGISSEGPPISRSAFSPEILRQLVHLSGLVFIVLAQFIDKNVIGVIFLIIAFFLFLYSEYITVCEKNHRAILSRIECKLRDFALTLERKDAKKPFAGAFWFYFSLGLSFLLFPFPAASAAGAVLSISDSLSTIIGIKFGKRRITGKKTLEGSTAFFVSAFLVCLLFFNPASALAGAIAATLAELLPETKFISSKGMGIVDDNFLIPLIAGFVLTIAVML